MIIRTRRAINYSGERARRWWCTREKGKEPEKGGEHDGVETGRGEGEERPPR